MKAFFFCCRGQKPKSADPPDEACQVTATRSHSNGADGSLQDPSRYLETRTFNDSSEARESILGSPSPSQEQLHRNNILDVQQIGLQPLVACLDHGGGSTGPSPRSSPSASSFQFSLPRPSGGSLASGGGARSPSASDILAKLIVATGMEGCQPQVLARDLANLKLLGRGGFGVVFQVQHNMHLAIVITSSCSMQPELPVRSHVVPP